MLVYNNRHVQVIVLITSEGIDRLLVVSWEGPEGERSETVVGSAPMSNNTKFPCSGSVSRTPCKQSRHAVSPHFFAMILLHVAFKLIACYVDLVPTRKQSHWQ